MTDGVFEDLLSPAQVGTIVKVRRICTTAGLTGAALSMAANVLASDLTGVGVVVGVTAPAAFILASEIATALAALPRTKGAKPLLAVLLALVVGIGAAAAVVSFGHIREVVGGVGESGAAEVLIALVVDALAVAGLLGHHLSSVYMRRHHTAVAAKAAADREAAALAAVEAEREAAEAVERDRRRAERAAARAASSTKAKATVTKLGPVAGDDPLLGAAERARAIKAANPGMTHAEIAAVVGRGERTVRRYLTVSTTASATDAGPEAGEPGNGAGDENTMFGESSEPLGVALNGLAKAVS